MPVTIIPSPLSGLSESVGRGLQIGQRGRQLGQRDRQIDLREQELNEKTLQERIIEQLGGLGGLSRENLERLGGLRSPTPTPAPPTFAESGPKLGIQLNRIESAKNKATRKGQVEIFGRMLGEFGMTLSPEIQTGLVGDSKSAKFFTEFGEIFDVSAEFTEKLLGDTGGFFKAIKIVRDIKKLQKKGLTKNEAMLEVLEPTDFKDLVADYVNNVASGNMTIEEVPEVFRVKVKDKLGRTPKEKAEEVIEELEAAREIVGQEGSTAIPSSAGPVSEPLAQESAQAQIPSSVPQRVEVSRGKLRIFEDPASVTRRKKLAALEAEEFESAEDANQIFTETGALPPKSIARNLWIQGRTEQLKLSSAEETRIDKTRDSIALSQNVLELFDAGFAGISGTGLAIASSRAGEIFRNLGVDPQTIRDFATFRNALDSTVAPIRQSLFGAALTDSEVKRSVNFLTDSIAALEKDPKAAAASMLKFYEIVSSKSNRFFNRLNKTKFFAKENIPTLDEFLASKSDEEIAGFASRGLITPKRAIRIRNLGIGRGKR